MKQIFTLMLRVKQWITLTEGEQSILLAFFGVGFFGAALALNVVMTIGGHAGMMEPFSAYDYWLILSGALGGMTGLYLGRGWMGFGGLRGVAMAIIGTVWISGWGSIVGGTIALPFYGTMFGPFTLFMSLFSAPWLALFWATILMSAHWLMLIWRREQASVVDAILPAPAQSVQF